MKAGGYSGNGTPRCRRPYFARLANAARAPQWNHPPHSWRPCRSGSSKSCQVGEVWRGVDGRHCRPGSPESMS
eukprot:9609-Chlamydomonas_euryale.AAC.1